jgi:MoaA/NifB/PqqE/SkfB family radical SAM enzyme
MNIIKSTLNNVVKIRDNNIFVNNKLVEIDADFIKSIVDKKLNPYIKCFGRTLLIDVTSRCNTHCKYCYYPIDNNSKDKSISSIVQEATNSGFKEVGLIGAEPTTREDLPELIKALSDQGFLVNITTNGLKLVNKEYLDTLITAGLKTINYSMHFANEFKVTKNKVQILKNIHDTGIRLLQLAFTVSSMKEISSVLEIIEYIEQVGIQPTQVCIRAGAAIGVEIKDSGLFLSDMVKYLETKGAKIFRNCGNNLYFCEMRYKKQVLHVVRWPNNDTTLPYSMTGPVFSTEKGNVFSPMVILHWLNKDEELVEITPKLLENRNAIF